jgi:pentapeptide repeat protein
MTLEGDSGEVAAAPSSESSAAFSDLGALRKAHLELRELAEGSALSPAEAAARIRRFLTDARKTGATLINPGDRRAAQGVLDFWSAELAGNPTAMEADFVPVMLAPPNASQTFDRIDASIAPAAASESTVDQRALIRLSAMARQWRDSGRQPGYLLTGETIKEAAQYKDKDINLAEFVEASQNAVERQHKIRTIVFSGVVGAVVAFAMTVAALWYFSVVGNQIRDIISRKATSGSNPAAALWWLDLFQPLLPPYDLSGTPQFVNVSEPKLRLYAPNFSGVSFSNVAFPGAIMPAASFSGSTFSFDGGGHNDFSTAELRQAQFRGARIVNTSFKGADLYRASFDRSLLCNVDFTGANLRKATFWAVSIDDGTKDTLRRTAWWLAFGWPWDQIEKLAPPRGNSANLQEDERLQDSLRDSPGFKFDIQTPIESIKRSSAGSVERAVALNSFAWIDAIWGIDIGTPKQRNLEATATDPCAATGLPTNAVEAARQAVCIAGQLNRDGDNKGKYTALLSNLLDTQAYVFLQNSEPAKALESYGVIAREDPKFLEDPEISFRYAIAIYAGGQDKNTGITRLKNAVQNGLYQPTHELHTLRNYIFPVKEFVEALRTSTNELWPTVKNPKVCPASNVTPAAK